MFTQNMRYKILLLMKHVKLTQIVSNTELFMFVIKSNCRDFEEAFFCTSNMKPDKFVFS